MYQQWIGLGRMTAGPEMKQSKSGGDIANFSIATDSGFGDHKHTEFTRCVCLFPKLAEIIGRYGKKGDIYQIVGIMVTNKWEDSEGKTRYSTECRVSDFKMCSPKSESGGGGSYGGGPSTGEDVPFAPIF